MAEYSKMIVISMIAATLFLGGYRQISFPFLNLNGTFFDVDVTWWLGPIYLFLKLVILLFGMIWVRATWPRIRYDRLMALGWKVLLPLSLALVVITAFGILLADQLGSIYLVSIPVLSVIAGAVAVLSVNYSMRRKVAHA
jgi:NADH-quinone oxidoreductase subunit H